MNDRVLLIISVLVASFCATGGLAQTSFSTAYSFYGAGANEALGWSVSGAGDVDGDGFDDLIVGTPQNSLNGLWAGSARVYSGADGSLLHAFLGDDIGDRFGISVSGAGDVNGDGYADLVVGAFQDEVNGPESGSARVLSGVDGSVLYDFFGGATSHWFGQAVSGAGDVNNDGLDDVIVGAVGVAVNGLSSGSIRVFSGADGSTLHNLYGGGMYDWFGHAVSDAGDVNGDGYADFIVGALSENSVGSARVFSGLDGSVLHSYFGDVTYGFFGDSVSGAGDVNGDGFDDFIVGAARDDDNGNFSGSARVYSGADGSVLHGFLGDGPNHYFGHSVSGVGDVDGDGRPDILVGGYGHGLNGVNSGSAQIFSGADGSVILSLYGNAGDQFGWSVSGAGDVNGDGFGDLIVGAPRDDTGGQDAGCARVQISPTLPVLVRRSEGAGGHLLDVAWQPDSGDPFALTGSLSCSGATPGATGLSVTSLVGIDYLAFGYLPVLVAVDPASLLHFGGFAFDLAGTLQLFGLSRQLPALAGYPLHVQFFETSPVASSSPALRFEIVP